MNKILTMRMIIIGLDVFLFILPFFIIFLKIIGADVSNPVVKEFIDNSSFNEIFVIPMLSLVVLETFNFKYDYESFKRSIKNDLSNINNKISLNHFDIKEDLKGIEVVTNGIKLHNCFRFHELKHPYFKEIVNQKFEDFMNENIDLFNNKYTTTPAMRDTFGAEGIRGTEKSLRCVSSISDYWNGQGNDNYLSAQETLIQNKVEIKRLFVVNKSTFTDALSEMGRQENMGIEVKAIDEEIMIKGGNFRDYLIQDGVLLVDLVIPKGINNGDYIKDRELVHMEADEIITFGCRKRVTEFEKHWDRGKTLEKIKSDNNVFFESLT